MPCLCCFSPLPLSVWGVGVTLTQLELICKAIWVDVIRTNISNACVKARVGAVSSNLMCSPHIDAWPRFRHQAFRVAIRTSWGAWRIYIVWLRRWLAYLSSWNSWVALSISTLKWPPDNCRINLYGFYCTRIQIRVRLWPGMGTSSCYNPRYRA
jgi:hypothetical protein